MSYAKDFDNIVINNTLEDAIRETENLLTQFLNDES